MGQLKSISKRQLPLPTFPYLPPHPPPSPLLSPAPTPSSRTGHTFKSYTPDLSSPPKLTLPASNGPPNPLPDLSPRRNPPSCPPPKSATRNRQHPVETPFLPHSSPLPRATNRTLPAPLPPFPAFSPPLPTPAAPQAFRILATTGCQRL